MRALTAVSTHYACDVHKCEGVRPYRWFSRRRRFYRSVLFGSDNQASISDSGSCRHERHFAFKFSFPKQNGLFASRYVNDKSYLDCYLSIYRLYANWKFCEEKFQRNKIVSNRVILILSCLHKSYKT